MNAVSKEEAAQRLRAKFSARVENVEYIGTLYIGKPENHLYLFIICEHGHPDDKDTIGHPIISSTVGQNSSLDLVS